MMRTRECCNKKYGSETLCQLQKSASARKTLLPCQLLLVGCAGEYPHHFDSSVSQRGAYRAHTFTDGSRIINGNGC